MLLYPCHWNCCSRPTKNESTSMQQRPTWKNDKSLSSTKLVLVFCNPYLKNFHVFWHHKMNDFNGSVMHPSAALMFSILSRNGRSNCFSADLINNVEWVLRGKVEINNCKVWLNSVDTKKVSVLQIFPQ